MSLKLSDSDWLAAVSEHFCDGVVSEDEVDFIWHSPRQRVGRERGHRQMGDMLGAIVTLSLPFITEASPGHLTPCSGWQHPRVSCSPASEDSPISGRFERGRLKRLPWHS